MKPEIYEAINNDTIYDYVANHYYEMSKEELRDLFLELYYSLYSRLSKDQTEWALVRALFATSLAERYE